MQNLKSLSFKEQCTKKKKKKQAWDSPVVLILYPVIQRITNIFPGAATELGRDI